MTVQAKFWVKEKRHLHGGHPSSEPMAEIVMAPVYDEANKPWSKATPQGEIKMLITNPSAIDYFDLGEKYLIEFTKESS